MFIPYTAAALLKTVNRALAAYADAERWQTIQHNALAADFSWRTSALHYAALYERAIQLHHSEK